MLAREVEWKENTKPNLIFLIITALDAANPCYFQPCPLPLSQRIDASDAICVQGIHTNNGGFGAAPRYACVDFQVNNGYSQPDNEDPLDSHIFAVRIFASTLDLSKACNGTSTDATGQQSRVGVFNYGNCGPCGKYQVNTNGKPPYCPITDLVGALL